MNCRQFPYFIITIFSLILSGCYKDKGHYKYIHSPKVDFENISTVNYSFLAYEPFEIDAPIKFSERQNNIEENYNIEWFLNKKLIYTGYHLKYEIDQAGTYELILRVKNKNTGEIFISKQPLSIRINNSFEWGWMVLSDMGDGKSSLSFITPAMRSYHHIEKTIEGGLGTGPKNIFYYYVLGSIPGEYVTGLPKILINQSSGSITLDGNSLQKDMSLSDEFENGKEPENLNMSAFAFKNIYYIIFDTKGNGFIRGVGVENKKIPYYGKYSANPFELEGGGKIGCVSTFNNVSFHCFNEKNCLIYDSVNGRFISIIPPRSYYKPMPEIVYLRTYDQKLNIPSEVLKVDNMGINTKCLAIGAYENVDIEGKFHAIKTWTKYVSLIDVNGIGDYMIHEFSVRKIESKSHLITDTDQYKFSGAGEIKPESIVKMSSNFAKNPYFYFTDGDKNLYVYSMQLRRHTLLYKGTSKINFIGASPITSEFAGYGGHSTEPNYKLAVAQENGEIVIIDVSKNVVENLFEGINRTTVIKTFTNFGNVKGIVWCTNWQGEY